MKNTLKFILLTLILFSITLTKPVWSQIEYIENDEIRVGVDISKGGAISYLSLSGSTESVVNIHDRGRYIQQSYYSGPQPFIPEGAQQHPAYAGWAWNPVQAGDAYNNSSQTIDYNNDGTTLYVKCIPKQWALNNIDSESFMEAWISLDENRVHVRNRLTNYREDQTQYFAPHQELPAIYTVGTLHRLFTYNGYEPFTGGAVVEISNNGPPWEYWYSMESWSALVNDDNWGLGIFNPGAIVTVGGVHGTPGIGGPYSDNTGYIAPLHVDYIDHDIVYNFEYALILGDLYDDIRSYVYENAPETGPNYVFNEDRQHCLPFNVIEEETPPFAGSWKFTLNHIDSQILTPPAFWDATAVPSIFVKATYNTQTDQAEVYFAGVDGLFTPEKRVQFTIIPDGEVHIYEIDLSVNPLYTDKVQRLRFDPLWGYTQGDEVNIYSIRTSVNTGNDILSFELSEQTGNAIINQNRQTVNIEVANGTNITALTPTIEISDYATIDPKSGTAQDFTQPFVYTVTAENGDEQEWTVTVDVLTGITSANPGGFKIYPNPSNGVFTIETPNSPARAGLLGLEIFAITGKTILKQAQEHAPVPSVSLPLYIDISATTGHDPLPGIYFIKIKTETGTQTKKLVIQ